MIKIKRSLNYLVISFILLSSGQALFAATDMVPDEQLGNMVYEPMTPIDCLSDSDCPQNMPVCVEKYCAGCEINNDCERFGEVPFCDKNTGECL